MKLTAIVTLQCAGGQSCVQSGIKAHCYSLASMVDLATSPLVLRLLASDATATFGLHTLTPLGDAINGRHLVTLQSARSPAPLRVQWHPDDADLLLLPFGADLFVLSLVPLTCTDPSAVPDGCTSSPPRCSPLRR